MGFYGPEPFDTAQAIFVETTSGFGVYLVDVEGRVRNYTAGITLVTEWAGPCPVTRVMGWTGPLGQGTRPYRVSTTFEGHYCPEICIIGENKKECIPVRRVPLEQGEDTLRERALAEAG